MTPFESTQLSKELIGSCNEVQFHWGKIYCLANKKFKIQSFFRGYEDKIEYNTLLEAFKAVPNDIRAPQLGLRIQHS